MSENAIAIRDEMTLADTLTLGQTLAKSGYFSDAKEAAQAVVKILAGREMGFGAIASMTGINIIQGRVAVSANLMASAIKRDPRYNYRVVTLTDDECEIAFFEGGQEVGRSVFTKEDARRASTKNMDKFPRNMLFARALSNGLKWYCPDASNGQTVYTPEELGADVNENGDVINITPTTLKPPEPPATKPPEQGEPAATKRLGDIPNAAAYVMRKAREMGLSDAEAHQALGGLESAKDYEGDAKEALAQIGQWVKEQADRPTESALDEVTKL